MDPLRDICHGSGARARENRVVSGRTGSAVRGPRPGRSILVSQESIVNVRTMARAATLACLALVTLGLKFWLEARHGDALAQSHKRH